MYGSDVPKPDPRISEAQNKLADLGVRQNEFFETNIAPRMLDQLDQSLEISRDQATKSNQMQDYQLDRAKIFNKRWDEVQVPLEDRIIASAKKYNERGEQERMAGEAGADVQQAFGNSQAQLTRGLAARGIDAGGAGAVSAYADMQTQRALMQAGAVNKTREAARQIGWTRLGEAAALGRGLPGFGASSAQLSMAAGQNASQNGMNGNTAVNGASNTANNSFQTGSSIWGTAGQLGVSNYNAGVNAANVSANHDPFNTILGAAAGAGGSMLMGKFGG